MSSLRSDKLSSKPAGGTSAAKKVSIPSALTLTFPTPTADPTASLTPLKDDSSSYAVVAKSCLELCQYAGHGSSANIEESTTMDSSSLFHDPSYAATVSSAFAALMTCLREHKERRCRILAGKTLAIVARAAYARIRHSPLVYSMREPLLQRLEDEAGTDVPVALVTAALEDADDGVSAAAVEALGIMILSSSFTTGSLGEDELTREIQSIAFAAVSPYAPTLRAVVDEDPSIPQTELHSRICENVMSPRLLHMVDRVLQYPESSWICVALPCLTTALIHQVQTLSPDGMDRSTFTQRWSEVDVVGLVDAVIDGIILPALQQHHVDGALAKTAALSGIRLAHACSRFSNGSAFWATRLMRSVVNSLYQELMAKSMVVVEDQLTTLSAVIIALRVLPLQERTSWLLSVADYLYRFLPATTVSPVGVSSAGLMLEYKGLQEYRKPARVGLWTEIALSFFCDGPEDPSGRSMHLETFMASPLVSTILTQSTDDEETSTLSPRTELLLAFTTVAIETGRRFRVGPDGNIFQCDPETPELEEWKNLVWVVLTTFASCVHLGPSPVYLEENLSFITAGLANYVQLLQEYLHTTGLLKTTSSVSIKLTSNACPPHILWDRMADSAALLTKTESFSHGSLDFDLGTRFMDELVARERKQGIPSHHMRLFLLALASDHWVQCRVISMRGETDNLQLNVQSGRDIVLALSPKRLLAKMFAAHVPPPNNARRDPIKKLALETVRMCVACIENMALSAITWRKRQGSGGSSDAKKIVSAAVSVLQGKLDDTAADDNIRAVMGPLCEAAVRRIQAFYEGDSSVAAQGEFPLSELVLQPGKTKIKPLISSTKPPPCPRDVFMRAYVMELSRQIVTSRAQQAMWSRPAADTICSPARPVLNWLRLAVPPVPESRDGRIHGNFGAPLSAWGNSVQTCSTGSDAAQIVCAYSPTRYPRYDGEDEFRIGVSFRLFNMTAIDFLDGVRLEMGLSTPEVDTDDEVATQSAESLGSNAADLMSEAPLVSASVVYRKEIMSGEYLTWESSLSYETSSASSAIIPAVVYRNVKVESETIGVDLVGQDGGEASTTGGESKMSESGEDDFQVTNKQSEGSDGGDEIQTENVRVVGTSLRLSPLVFVQPCPLVFFRDSWGDAESFRFLWFRMPFQLPPLRIGKASASHAVTTADPIALRIASMSRLRWAGEAIPGGFASRSWAFSSLKGRILLCIFAESESDGAPGKQALYFRGNCQTMLFGLVNCEATRQAVVASIVPGMVPITS